jgi:hypothetical protein
MRSILHVFALAVLLAGCARTAPEQALRRDIAAMQAAIEAREPGTLADGLAEDFVGPQGMDRTAARRMAQVVFLRNRAVGATFGPLDIAMGASEREATVKFTAAVTGGSGALLPSSGQVYDVTTGWRMEGDAWQLVTAEWSPKL